MTPAVRIKWEGKDFIDPNGFVFEKPVKYKYKLYKSGPDIPWSRWLSEPDSLRRQVAPEFAGWDSTGPDSAEVQYTNLTPQNEYLFVVVAIGRSGAYSPIFSLDSNMLKMYVGFAGALGPMITLFNSFFSYTYPSGGFPSPLDPSWAVQLQVPAGAAPDVQLDRRVPSPEGSLMKRYRWVLDLVRAWTTRRRAPARTTGTTGARGARICPRRSAPSPGRAGTPARCTTSTSRPRTSTVS